MIIDTLSNADKYISIHPLFAEAFAYIKSQNLSELEIGKSDVANGLKAIVAEKVGMLAVESIAKFECHNKNIDSAAGMPTFSATMAFKLSDTSDLPISSSLKF